MAGRALLKSQGHSRKGQKMATPGAINHQWSILSDQKMGLGPHQVSIPIVQLQGIKNLYDSEDAYTKAVTTAAIQEQEVMKLWRLLQNDLVKIGTDPITKMCLSFRLKTYPPGHIETESSINGAVSKRKELV